MKDTSTSRLANVIFGSTATGVPLTDFNLTFEDGSFPNDTDGTASGSGPADMSAFEATIKLNTNTMPHASQEFIAATIMHEVLHAMMNYHQYSPSTQHQTMSESYIYNMKMDLLSMYPKMKPADAEALAWGA